MSRVQRKFFLISAAVHGLLLVVLLVGPAFMSRHRASPPQSLPILYAIPERIIDEAFSGGGQPEASVPEPKTDPAPAAVVAPPAAVSPPVQKPPASRPTPKQRANPAPAAPKQPAVTTEPARTPDPARTVQKPQTKESAEPKATAVPNRSEVKVSKSLVSQVDDGVQNAKAEAAKRERDRLMAQREEAARSLQDTLEGALTGLRKTLSKQTTVEMPGPGGAAYASYRQVVQTVYARAWIEPQELAGRQASVQVEVTINNDGRVLSERVLSESGNSVLDRSVRDALDRVRSAGLPAFPDEARRRGDLQRVFRINFNLSSKNSLG